MTTETTGALATGTERLHALDAVRGGALWLGVFLHAAMSFLPGQQVWMIRDQESTTLGVLFYVIHMFRMVLFFLLAGFFARMVLERKGWRSFARDRLKRIGIPLVSFWPILFPAIAAVFVWGVARQWGWEAVQSMPQPQGSILETFPLTHLWFLYVLLWLYAGALAMRGLATLIAAKGSRLGRSMDAAVAAAIRGGLAPLALAAPTGLALYLKDDWLMWLGVPTPDYGLLPNTPALVAFAVALGFGWLLQRQVDLLHVLQRRWLPHLVAAVALTALSASIGGISATLDASTQVAAHDPVLRLVVAASYPLGTWAWTFGLIGLALRFLSEHRPAIRYVADSSYWIYLIHLPIVMVAQILLFPVQLPPLAKYALVLAISIPIMPLSYHLLVRFTFLGALLNGRRRERHSRVGGEAPALARAER